MVVHYAGHHYCLVGYCFVVYPAGHTEDSPLFEPNTTDYRQPATTEKSEDFQDQQVVSCSIHRGFQGSKDVVFVRHHNDLKLD